MKAIEFEYYEINDLYRTLEYALKKKKEDLEKERINELMYKMDKNKILNLIARLPKKEKIENRLEDMLI